MTDACLDAALRETIADVPDFPKQGVVFKDITPVLEDAELFQRVTAAFAEHISASGATHICAVESRGFIFGAPIAHALDLPLVLVRKPGKLPRDTRSVTYELEYGTDTLEIHSDAVDQNARVAVVDDLLATGGTAAATLKLIESCGASIATIAFMIELGFLDGRSKLGDADVFSLVNWA